MLSIALCAAGLDERVPQALEKRLGTQQSLPRVDYIVEGDIISADSIHLGMYYDSIYAGIEWTVKDGLPDVLLRAGALAPPTWIVLHVEEAVASREIWYTNDPTKLDARLPRKAETTRGDQCSHHVRNSTGLQQSVN